MAKPQKPQRDGYVLIYRAWTTTKDGKRIYAKWFGKKAFPIWIPVGE